MVVAAVLYARARTPPTGAPLRRAPGAAERGEGAVRLSAQAIRGVALGVVVTALVQTLIGGLGLAIAGVPFASLLTAVMFLLAVAQIGAAPVMVWR